MSAPSPRPSAFLGIGNDLLGELRVTFCALAVNIVKNNRFAEAPSFGKPIIFYDIHSKGAEGYTQLAQEVIANAEKRLGTGARSAHSGA